MANSSDSPDSAEFHLDPDEAVVLFALLSRWCEDVEARSPGADCFDSTAECAVIHRLLGNLERQLVAPFRHDFGDIVALARKRIEPQWDYPTLKG